MIELVSSPEKLAVDLWAADFIAYQTKDDVVSTQTSNYAKASKLLHEVFVYFKECDERKEMERFCEIIKKDCNPGIEKVTDSILSHIR